MIWLVLLIVAVFGAFPAHAERWLVPDALPDGSVPDAIGIGDPDATLDYYRIDGVCALTLEGPGVLRFTICGPADTETDSPETLRVAIDGLTGYPPHQWVEVATPSKRTAFAGEPRRPRQPSRVSSPSAFRAACSTFASRARASGADPCTRTSSTTARPPRRTSRRARSIRSRPIARGPGGRARRSRSPPLTAAWRPEDAREYYRIDQGCPVRVTGPGLLRLFARAHAQPGRPEPQQLAVSITGLPGLGEQRWVEPLRTASALRFGDGRPGFPTDARKVVLSIPEGVHDLLVTGTTDGTDPVYATFGFQAPAPPPPPVVRAERQSEGAAQAQEPLARHRRSRARDDLRRQHRPLLREHAG